jgi:hypothetical protein
MHPSRTVVHWCITMAITMSTQSLLFVLDEPQQQPLDHSLSPQSPLQFTTLFWLIVISLGIVIPIWKRHLAKYKVILRGPWDIPTKDDMKLDYKLRL